MPDILEEVLNTANAIAPIWNDDVWGALQARRFDKAETHLQNHLSKMSASEWSGVYWIGIVKGIPAFRGELDETTWETEALPRIGEAILTAATPIKISSAYSSINSDSLAAFHNFILSSIAETAADKKLWWIKMNLPSLFNFFLANPLGLHLTASLNFLTKQSLTRLKTLQENLRAAIFSAQTAEIIKKICEQNNVPEEKISAVAGATGLVLLGFLHPEELPQEIGERANLAQPAGKAIADSLDSRIFAPLRETLDKIYAPLPHEEPATASIILEEIKKPGIAPAKPEIDIAKTFGVGQLGPLSTPTAPPTFGPKFNGQWSNLESRQVPTKPSAAELPTEPATAVGEPKPKILHEETAAKPLRSASGFSIKVPINLSDSSVKAAPTPPRPAVLEFGIEPPKPEVKNLSGPPKAPRVVHYTNLRTPLQKTGAPSIAAQIKPEVGKESSREIKEITATVPPSPAASKSKLPMINKIEPPMPKPTPSASPAAKETSKIIPPELKPPLPPRPRIEPPSAPPRPLN